MDCNVALPVLRSTDPGAFALSKQGNAVAIPPIDACLAGATRSVATALLLAAISLIAACGSGGGAGSGGGSGGGAALSTGAPAQSSSATTPTTTTTSATTRDPLHQPFAVTSIWNMPIGSNAVYVPANIPAIPYSVNEWAPMPAVDKEIIVLAPTAPLTYIYYSSAAWTGADRCNATGGMLFQLPIPSNFVVPNGPGNNSAVFLKPDGRTLVHTQPFARCTAGASGTSLTTASDFPEVDLYGDGIRGSHGGSGLSAIGGSIRVGELRPGSQAPAHALKVAVYSAQVLFQCATASQCFRWPADRADSNAVGSYGTLRANNSSAMKMGALLAIPASTDLTRMGLETEPGRQLAWTLQNYGAYIDDSLGEPSFAIDAEEGANGSALTQFQADWGFPMEQRVNSNSPWSRDMQRLMTALYVVDNNSPTSIGGGGTPLQPLAPSL